LTAALHVFPFLHEPPNGHEELPSLTRNFMDTQNENKEAGSPTTQAAKE